MPDSIGADLPDDLASAEAALNNLAELVRRFEKTVHGDLDFPTIHELLPSLKERYDTAKRIVEPLLAEIEAARGVTPFHIDAPRTSGRFDSTTASGALLRYADYVGLILTEATANKGRGWDPQALVRRFRNQIGKHGVPECQQAIRMELVQTAVRRRLATNEAAADGGRTVEAPRKLLTGWHDITTELGERYQDRRRIASLNERLNGPIKNSGRGTKPTVHRDELIAWWNQLAAMQHELANRRKGKRLSAKASYRYGRDAEVAPEVSGSVKRRRQRRKT